MTEYINTLISLLQNIKLDLLVGNWWGLFINLLSLLLGVALAVVVVGGTIIIVAMFFSGFFEKGYTYKNRKEMLKHVFSPANIIFFGGLLIAFCYFVFFRR